MLYLKIASIFLFLSIVYSYSDAAILSLNNNLNITWEYTKDETSFNISATLSSSIDPGSLKKIT